MTYSIVARDPKTGELGVAVQSHYFSVGSVVTWARSGIGAVATQSMAEVSYGPLGLELMAAGKGAEEALSSLLRSDQKAETRQVAMVDSSGRVSVHTGQKCIPFAGHTKGENYSCQANLMSNGRIWGAMDEAYRKNSDLQFPERLVATLEAAEEAGGDVRGKQSAALLVVSPKLFANSWEGRVMELRVEDSPEPLPELRRLVQLKRAYEWAEKGDDFLSSGNLEKAMDAFGKATDLAQGNEEIRFWFGVTLMGSGLGEEEGRSILKEVFSKNNNWISVTKGLLDTGYLPKDSPVSTLVP
jgi:uncharacterized Ntn-hydrolase superfamily protein